MKLPQLSLRDLFWLVLVCGMALGWWIDYTRKQEIYYLHIYSKRVKPTIDIYNPRFPKNPKFGDSQNAKFGDSIRIASIAITPDRRVSAEIPNYYDPTVRFKGKLTRRSTLLEGVLTISIESPETAFDYEHISPITIEEPNPFWEDYHFVVSRSENAYDPLDGSPR